MLSLLLGTILFSYTVDRRNHRNLQNLFDRKQKEIIEEVENTIVGYREILRGARGLYAASNYVGRSQWKNYVRSLILKDHFPAIRALAYAQVVRRDEMEAHIMNARDEGFNEYKIFPASENDFYVPATFLEPFNEINKKVHGFDTWSDPVRRKAMLSAITNNQTAMTSQINLVENDHEDHVKRGFLMFLPIAKHNRETVSNIEDIQGLVYGVFRVDKLFKSIDKKYPDINVEIFDGHEVDKAEKVYQSQVYQAFPQQKRRFNELQAIRHVVFEHHEWTLRLTSMPQFGAQINLYLPVIILLVGIALSLFCLSAFLYLRHAKNNAELIAFERTLDLAKNKAKLDLILDNAGDGISGEIL